MALDTWTFDVDPTTFPQSSARTVEFPLPQAPVVTVPTVGQLWPRATK